MLQKMFLDSYLNIGFSYSKNRNIGKDIMLFKGYTNILVFTSFYQLYFHTKYNIIWMHIFYILRMLKEMSNFLDVTLFKGYINVSYNVLLTQLSPKIYYFEHLFFIF